MDFKKTDIKTGFLCNNNCRFCVQAHKKRFGNRPKGDLKKDLFESKKNGCSGVVFTGGEFTIREDFLELVRYAKELGFQSIQIQTNARMLSYKDLCKRLIQAGANEFGPALHGHTEELHDYLTRAKGSFKQTVQAIKNLKELGQLVVMNTVVVKPNYEYLPEIAKFLVGLKVDQFQFAFVHAVGNAWDNYDEMIPDVSLAAPYIKKGLQIGLDNHVKVMAEAMPFCMMENYERYCSEFYIPKTEIRDVNSFDPNFEITRVTEGKMKFPQCKECKFDLVCEGPWREYPERKGSKEFVAVKGEKIKGMEDIERFN